MRPVTTAAVSRARRRSRDERGMTAMFVGMLAIGMVAVAAIVTDFGAVRQEQRELQGGADAAALAVLRECVDGNCNSNPNEKTQMADLNSSDNTSNVESLCGTAAVGLSACAESFSQPTAYGMLRVRLATRNSDGSTQVNYRLGRAVSSETGKQVRGTSYLAWGSPATLNATKLIVSKCDYDRAVNSGTLRPGQTTGVVTIVNDHHDWSGFQGSSAGFQGNGGPGIFAAPCGYSFLSDGDCIQARTADPNNPQGGTAQTVTDDGGTPDDAWDDTGYIAIPEECKAVLELNAQQDFYVPIYDGAQDCGANWVYKIVGFAKFRLTGYRFRDDKKWPNNLNCPEPPTATDGNPDNNGYCILGRFVGEISQQNTTLTDQNFGVLRYRFFDPNVPESLT